MELIFQKELGCHNMELRLCFLYTKVFFQMKVMIVLSPLPDYEFHKLNLMLLHIFYVNDVQ